MSVIHRVPPAFAEVAEPRVHAEFTLKLTPFDQRQYRRLIAARAETIQRVVGRLKEAFALGSALDAGCGVGFFSKTLADCGLNVCGFDGRAENIAEARKRFPQVPFETADIEDAGIRELGRFDFVLCCGLLYHLENPLMAMRNLRALTGKCLLVESMCIPEEKPSMLLREEPRSDDQSLTDVACYPSEGSLVKMLYRAGFEMVYRVTPLPKHDDFQRYGGTYAQENGFAGFDRGGRRGGIPLVWRAARNAGPVEQSGTSAGQRAAADSEISGEPGAQEVHHSCVAGAARVSTDADSVAAGIRRVVAGGKRRAGS